MRGCVAAALAACVLAACGEARQTAEDFPVVEAPSYDASIGPNGAAGISTPIAFTEAAVRAAAPNYIVASVEDQVEGDPFTAITLSAGDEEVFRIYPTADNAHVHAIATRSTQARGPHDEIVTVATFADAPPEETPFCFVREDGSGEFTCALAADSRFWRTYEAGELRRADAKLVEMSWIAPRAE